MRRGNRVPKVITGQSRTTRKTVTKDKPPTQPGIDAKFGGRCSVCTRPYAKGERISTANEGWGHQACAESWKAIRAINAGETFAGRKPSDFSRTRKRQD